MDIRGLGHTDPMFCCQGSFKFHGEVNKILSDQFYFLPFFLISAIEDQNGMKISIADVTEDGNGEIVLIANLLKLTNRFWDLGHGNPKVLDQRDQLRSPSDFRKGGNEALAARPHLQTFCRIIIPLVAKAITFLRDVVNLLDILFHGLAVSIDLNEKDASHIVWNIKSHCLVHDIDRKPVENFARRERDPRGNDFFSRFSCILDGREPGLSEGNIFWHGKNF